MEEEAEEEAAPSPEPPTPPHRDFDVGMEVRVRSPRRGTWHDCKVIETREGEVRIHFKGFKKTPANVRWLATNSKDIRLPAWTSINNPLVTPPAAAPPRMEFEVEDAMLNPIAPAKALAAAAPATSEAGASSPSSSQLKVENLTVGMKVEVEWGGTYYSEDLELGDDDEEGYPMAMVHYKGGRRLTTSGSVLIWGVFVSRPHHIAAGAAAPPLSLRMPRSSSSS